MKKYKIIFTFMLLSTISLGQQIDFGIEVQQNTNLVKKWLMRDELTEFNRAFSLTDINGDTMNLYFNQFSMVNNFEIPLYFRFNLQKRFFADFKISNVTHKLNMEGVANYSDNYFIANYGTYSDFETQAIANGFTNVDSADYVRYISNAKLSHQQNVRSTEEFKVLSFTANLGIRLLPQRSINPYVYGGFTWKTRYAKYTYSYFDFDNPNVWYNNKVQEGVNKFSQNTYYLNFGFGAEFYRFRAGVYYQGGLAFQRTNGQTNNVVYDVNPFTPFERIHSYGFNLSVNLFSATVGKKLVYDDIESQELVYSNIEEKRYKWDFQLRFNRRFFVDVTSFYTTPENSLSLLKRDSVLFSNGSEIQSGERIEMTTFGDLKKVQWTGQFDMALTRHLTRRLGIEFCLSSSVINADISTTEMVALIAHDTSGNSWYMDEYQPRINQGVFRSRFAMNTFSWALKYKVIDREIFNLAFIFGMGRTTMASVLLTYTDLPDGVNSLSLYDQVDEFYYATGNTNLYAHNGAVDVDFNSSPDVFTTNFGNTIFDSNWQTPKNLRFTYPMIRFGIEASVERFTLGLSIDKSRSYMDGFLLDSYSSFFFSVGYKLWMKEKKIK